VAWREDVPERKGLLQVATEIAGLFAGVATLVYVTGAIVLALRLAFKGLAWGNVVSQLPREFVLAIGAGQVLFPALMVGAVYGLYRLLRSDRPEAPKTYRLRDGLTAWGVVLGRYLLAAALLLVPLVAIVAARKDVGFGDLRFVLVLAILLVVLVTAAAVQEGRSIVIRHFDAGEPWNSLRAAGAMAGVYAGAALPAMLLGAAAIPLTDAKVCVVDGFSEQGYLVGESSDRVYLGEKPRGPNDGDQRRIAVIPLAKVEEVFFGTEAELASCEFAAPQPAADQAPPKGGGSL
jgi:hypothetical protein